MFAYKEAGYCALTSYAKLIGILRVSISYQYCGRHLMVEDGLILRFGCSIRSAKTSESWIILLS